MELVGMFSDEMNTVLNNKLPVSRAKMASITKHALKGVKFYKHIVMTVEKFVGRCPPEYKVPGLYVIDSIVRQSRHQFGVEKDNFGPRFSRNFEKTFLQLFDCPAEDKRKIIRVLNLWQKNGVFTPEVIQPLLALAPSPGQSPGSNSQPSVEAIRPGDSQTKVKNAQASMDLNSATQIIEQQRTQIQTLLQQQQQFQSQASNLLGPALQGLLSKSADKNELASLLLQSQALSAVQEIGQRNGDQPPAQISNARPIISSTEQPEFNTALLDDFDYSDDEDSGEKPPPETRIQENEPEDNTDKILQELQEQFQRREAAKSEQQPPLPVAPPTHEFPPMNGPPMPHFQPPLPPPHHLPPPHPDMRMPPHNLRMSGAPPPMMEFNNRAPPLPPNFSRHSPPRGRRGFQHSPPQGSYSARGRRRSPSPLRRHSGGPSWRDRDWDRERDRPWKRSRSPGYRNRSRSPPRRRSEDTDRLKRPNSLHKEKHVTVLSTTIWMGHLAKSVTKEQITEACSKHGSVQSVDVVHARGCAYIVMQKRPDAMEVLQTLKDVRLNGSACKLAWAPGRGVKGGSYRSYWNLDDGVSIIPWECVLDQGELNKLADGGWIEAGTCPPGMKVPEILPPLPPAQPPLVPTEPIVGHFFTQPAPPVPFPLMPSNNLPHPHGNSQAVDMQIASSPL